MVTMIGRKREKQYAKENATQKAEFYKKNKKTKPTREKFFL